MTTEFHHVIVTRFNLPSAGPESVIRAKEGWLIDRVKLFERYCLPSVMMQRNQQFEWIIYFDPESPDWLRRRIDEQAGKEIYVPIFRVSVDKADLVDDIRRVTGERGSRLITSNVDNDDALAIDFVERIQAAAPHSGLAAIYLARGLIKRDYQLYCRLDRHNAFPSVVEDWTAPSTCWADWHTLLGKHMAVLELHDGPGWLQVIHDSNVSNRVRGRLTSPASYRDLFPGLLDDVRVPRVVEAAADVMAARSWRVARDSFRSLAKGTIILLTGKDGLDEMKKRWATRPSRDKPDPEVTG